MDDLGVPLFQETFVYNCYLIGEVMIHQSFFCCVCSISRHINLHIGGNLVTPILLAFRKTAFRVNFPQIH